MLTGKILWVFVVDKLSEITAIIKDHVKRLAILEDEGLENRIKKTMKYRSRSDMEWCTSESAACILAQDVLIEDFSSR